MPFQAVGRSKDVEEIEDRREMGQRKTEGQFKFHLYADEPQMYVHSRVHVGTPNSYIKLLISLSVWMAQRRTIHSSRANYWLRLSFSYWLFDFDQASKTLIAMFIFIHIIGRVVSSILWHHYEDFTYQHP